MKLTKHQKEIVDKIISGEISDLPSYLRVFSKAHNRQYNPNIILTTFEKQENGATYFFKEDEYNFYTEIYDRTGALVKTLPVSNKMTYELKQYPLTSPVLAQLDMTIHPEQISFKGISYSFNFMKNQYLVADTFSDIRDFVALWSYLRREALVFEGKKPITEEDLSIFFEYIDQDISPQINPRWHQKVDIDSETENDPVPRADIYMIPKKLASNYIEKAWKMNHEHLYMCDEYIGIKMLATGELKNYQQSGYKTVEEKSQSRDLFAAWVAVVISLISVAIGNILPLFQKADTEYLDYISKQIAAIEERIETNTVSQDILSELDEIHDELSEIKGSLEDKTLGRLASQFHPTKNGKVSPEEISYASNKTYWWFLSYDDPDLGHFDFEWEAKVVNRTLLGEGCPYVGNDKVWKGYNDLLSRVPHIASEWHGTKNRRLRPDEVYKESTKKVWWKCSHCGYEWFGSIRGRTVNGIGCKKCHRNNPFTL